MATIDAQAATASADCKTEGCPREAVASRGPCAGLCIDCARKKRAAMAERARADHQARGGGLAPVPARPAQLEGAGPVAIARELGQAARELERAQTRARGAGRELATARRRWAELLRRAADAAGG